MALNSLTSFLDNLGLTKPTALSAQRIGALPEDQLPKVYEQWRERGELLHYGDLIVIARPYWYKASRERKHREIHAAAVELMGLDHPGPFPLIYADPPWEFEIYSEKGAERTPGQHYPTLSDEEIKAYLVDGKPIAEMAHKDAALLLWCTSSNQDRALAVMAAWGFEFKSSAVWVKAVKPDDDGMLTRFGLGLVFRNMHEVLLYGTRGSMPGPQYQPPSVFFYPRGEHSAKPTEIRTEIEKMYPDFDERTRLELFARERCPGWSRYGFEA
jgi:N6-adenosine-specific RNA methylase IME4